MRPRKALLAHVGSAVLWFAGTVGRSIVFAGALAAVVTYDNWTADQYPDDGASFIFVLVWPAEALVAGLWAATDAWRRVSWVWLTVRWCLVSVTAALAETASSIDTGDGLYSWHDLPASLVEQLVVILIGAGAGAAIGKFLLAPAQAVDRYET